MSVFDQQLYEARFGRKMTNKTATALHETQEFTTQIDRWIIDTEEKLLLVMQEAIFNTVVEANRNKHDGGDLPIDTGFLWSSGVAELNELPRGPSKGEKEVNYSWSYIKLMQKLGQMKVGDTFYFGWTAVYARIQEVRNGFLGSALMNWQRNVDAAVAKVRNK